MLKCRGQGVELYMLGEGGLGWTERVASGAFPGGLRWSGAFLNVNQLLSDMYEVLVWLPGVLGDLGCCCSRDRGGS